MSNEVSTTSFTLPNRDGIAKASGGIFKLAVIAAIGFAAYVFILPFLLTIVWGTVELAIGIPVAIFLLWILTNKKFWRALNYFSQMIAEKLLGLAIEMNPFSIMQNQVDQARKDREDLHKQTVILQGQQAKLQGDMGSYDSTMNLAWGKAQKCKAEVITMAAGEQKDKVLRQFQKSMNEYTNAKDYIDSVKPIYDSIVKLVKFGDKAYDMSGDSLNDAEFSIKTQRAKYDAVTTGSRAMARAQAAFTGRADLNADSEKAMEYLRKDIGNKIGAIKDSLKITSAIMDDKDLTNSVKAEQAAESAQQFNLDSKFKYSASLDDQSAKDLGVINVSRVNRFEDLLKK